MLIVTQQQASRRWDSLTPQLREALFSDVNDDFIRKLCESEHIPDDKQEIVFGATGCVLMGFLHPEDLAGEIQGAAGLNSQVANALASAINQRVFLPIRGDIDRVYNPSPGTGTNAGSTAMQGGPKIIQDIGSPTTKPPVPITPPGPPIPIPKVISQTGTPAPAKLNLTPLMAAKPQPTAPPVAGWSRATQEQPVVKLSQSTMPGPQAAPRIPTTPPPQAPKTVPIPIKGPVGEFERRSILSGGAATAPTFGSATPKPAASAPAGAAPTPKSEVKPAELLPIIIHQDSSSTPQQTVPDFHFPLPSQIMSGGRKDMGSSPLKPAVLELGTAPAAQKSSGMASTRVVHYTEYKSPSPENPVLPKTPPGPPPLQGPRQVTEVTAQNIAPPPIPKPMAVMTPPASPPMPPTPPMPPVPPPAKKIVYKDYSASEMSSATPPTTPKPQTPPAPPTPPPQK